MNVKSDFIWFVDFWTKIIVASWGVSAAVAWVISGPLAITYQTVTFHGVGFPVISLLIISLWYFVYCIPKWGRHAPAFLFIAMGMSEIVWNFFLFPSAININITNTSWILYIVMIVVLTPISLFTLRKNLTLSVTLLPYIIVIVCAKLFGLPPLGSFAWEAIWNTVIIVALSGTMTNTTSWTQKMKRLYARCTTVYRENRY